MTTAYDVIILGGGLSGIAAAQRLSAENLRVALIEARPRFGGRAWTLHAPGLEYPIELGAEWFDAKGPLHTLLARKTGAAHRSTGSFLRRVHGELRAFDEPDDAWIELHRRLEAVEGKDRSLTAALAECCSEPGFAEAAESLRQYVSGFHAADPDQLSLEWLRAAEQNESASDADLRTPFGLDHAVNAMLARVGASCTVYLDTRATAVRWRERRVAVDVESNGVVATLTANAAVITLPLSVLRLESSQAGSVKFTPALSTKRQAFDLLATGPVIKLVCAFDAPFWRDLPKVGGALFLQDPTQAIPTWWTAQPVDAPVLVGWVAGPMVARVGSLERRALARTAMHSLAHLLDLPARSVTKRLRRWYWHDWQHDPLAQGAYSWARVGGIDAHEALAASLSRTLYFAGEATHGDGLNATMDGAIESGWRAASELLQV